MGTFTVKKYIDHNGRCRFDEWYKTLPTKDQARVEARLLGIERVESRNIIPSDWFKHLGGSRYELRIKGQQGWLRPLTVKIGSDIVILSCPEKKSKKLKASDNEVADRLEKELKDGKGKIEPWRKI